MSSRFQKPKLLSECKKVQFPLSCTQSLLIFWKYKTCNCVDKISDIRAYIFREMWSCLIVHLQSLLRSASCFFNFHSLFLLFFFSLLWIDQLLNFVNFPPWVNHNQRNRMKNAKKETEGLCKFPSCCGLVTSLEFLFQLWEIENKCWWSPHIGAGRLIPSPFNS